MQDTERKAFDEILAEIFAAIDKPLGEAQRAVFWKGLRDLGIVEFGRIADFLVRDFREREEPPRKFTVGDIWTARKRLRASAPPTSDEPEWHGDNWDIQANNHMLALVLRATLAKRKLSPFETRIYVAFKNRWAQIMRESEVNDGVPASDQKHCWQECMRMADEEIARCARAAA